MIKKNTKVIFEDGENKKSQEMIGGLPLSKGETIKVHEGGKSVQYEVAEKIVECFLSGNDQTVNITYILKKS